MEIQIKFFLFRLQALVDICLFIHFFHKKNTFQIIRPLVNDSDSLAHSYMQDLLTPIHPSAPEPTSAMYWGI